MLKTIAYSKSVPMMSLAAHMSMVTDCKVFNNVPALSIVAK